MPPSIIVQKIYGRIYDKVYYHYRKMMNENLKVDLDENIFEDWDSDIKFIVNTDDNLNLTKMGSQISMDDLLIQADSICMHSFDLLGSGPYIFEDAIEWNLDFKSGFAWENKFYKDIEIIDLNNDADVKVPWELSRFQHVTILGEAFLESKDYKYSKEFKHEFESWVKGNPFESSVNWTCSMEVAIRACNFILAYMYFKESIGSKEFWKSFNKILFIHGDFIYKNLERGFPSNNHYISNLVGLVWLGIYFRSHKTKSRKASKWLEFSLKELEKEMDLQVYSDGFNFEASTAYHCLTTELFLYTSILCKKNNISFSYDFNKKLEKMCEVTMNITKPNGLIPLIGDMDSGRFIKLVSQNNLDMRDFRNLLKVSGEYFGREDIKLSTDLNGKKLESRSYPEGGVHILRNKKLCLFLRCGKNGTEGKCGHTHNDQLSFELNVSGQDFIIDPGSYVYTSDYKMRNIFRGTGYHNTLKIDGYEQNDFNEKEIFFMQDQTNAIVNNFDSKYFSGKHFGYEEKLGIIHEREIVIEEDEIIIDDRVLDENFGKRYTKVINLIFDYDVSLYDRKGSVLASKNGVEIEVFIDSDYRIEDTFISKAYGKIQNSSRILIQMYDKESKLRIKY